MGNLLKWFISAHLYLSASLIRSTLRKFRSFKDIRSTQNIGVTASSLSLVPVFISAPPLPPYPPPPGPPHPIPRRSPDPHLSPLLTLTSTNQAGINKTKTGENPSSKENQDRPTYHIPGPFPLGQSLAYLAGDPGRRNRRQHCHTIPLGEFRARSPNLRLK